MIVRSTPATAALAVAVHCIVSFAGGGLQAQTQRAKANAEFLRMLDKVDAAQLELQNGRAAAFKALWSHADEITLSGGFGGGVEQGWAKPGQAREVTRDYRVTMVFRKQADGWRLVHRQADSQLVQQAPQ